MILSGDEYGQTRHGNNNWYGHDGEMTQFDWSQLADQQDWFTFYKSLINFRRSCPLLGRREFLTHDCITWHEDNWDDPASKFLAFTLHDRQGEYDGDVYCAINAHNFEVTVNLPHPEDGKNWRRIIDTNLPAPRDFVEGGNAGVERDYRMQSHSVIVLVSR